MYYIEVVIPLSLDKIFTYALRKEEYKYVSKGFRVAVPFGKSKIYTALVIGKHTIKPQEYDPKEIHQIIDQHPVVNEIQIKHWNKQNFDQTLISFHYPRMGSLKLVHFFIGQMLKCKNTFLSIT